MAIICRTICISLSWFIFCRLLRYRVPSSSRLIANCLSEKCQKCKEQEPSRDHKLSILENVAFLRDCTSATLPHFEVALVGARPLYLAAQDRAATQTPRWGVRCFANAVLLGRACPKPCWEGVWQTGTCRGKAPPSCYARPFCRLKAPLGLSLFCFAPQTRIFKLVFANNL